MQPWHFSTWFKVTLTVLEPPFLSCLWISKTSTLIHFNPMCSFRSYWALRLTLTLFFGLDRFCAIGHSVRVWMPVLVMTSVFIDEVKLNTGVPLGRVLCRIFFSICTNENATSLFWLSSDLQTTWPLLGVSKTSSLFASRLLPKNLVTGMLFQG